VNRAVREKNKYSVDIRLCVTIDVDSKYYDKREKEREREGGFLIII
jgi:hypothetical protein